MIERCSCEESLALRQLIADIRAWLHECTQPGMPHQDDDGSKGTLRDIDKALAGFFAPFDWREQARAKNDERGTWVKLGAADERLELIEIFKQPVPDGIVCGGNCRRKLVTFLEGRVKASGVTVRSCSPTRDLEVHGPDGPPPARAAMLPAPEGRIGALTAEIADRQREIHERLVELRTLEVNAEAIVGRMHRHSCPLCFESEACDQPCSTVADLDSKGWRFGSHIACGNCSRDEAERLRDALSRIANEYDEAHVRACVLDGQLHWTCDDNCPKAIARATLSPPSGGGTTP